MLQSFRQVGKSENFNPHSDEGNIGSWEVVKNRVKSVQKLLILLLVIAWLSGCEFPSRNATPKPTELYVYAAASLTEAFGEIGAAFESTHPGVVVVFNFAGSQQLAQQIDQGAAADVFASANQLQMEVLVTAGLVRQDSVRTFARNRLVVIFPIDNPGGLTSLQDLAKPGLHLVLAAKEVPVGQYTLEFLNKAAQDDRFGTSYRQALLANVMSYENNVKAVFTKVALGEADAGIVYSSDVIEAQASEIGEIDIPEDLNVIAVYPAAPVISSHHMNLANTFLDFVLASQAQAILAKYGFVAPKP